MDLTLTREQTERLSQQIASHVVSTATQLRHFFLVEDLVDSLKVPPTPHPQTAPGLSALSSAPILGAGFTQPVGLSDTDAHPAAGSSLLHPDLRGSHLQRLDSRHPG